MKKTFLFAALAAFTLLATSCGDADAEASSSYGDADAETSGGSVIGTPIRLGNLEVAQKDFPEGMLWNEAKQACAILGAGWRLPTKEELNALYVNLKQLGVGGFASNGYWSSTETDNGGTWAWLQDFSNGGQVSYPKEHVRYSVRAVRAFSGDSPIVDDGSVIGTPIRLGNLEVAQKDFPKVMSWIDAKQACAILGAGWRLPTKEELNLLYENKAKIGINTSGSYWSSTKYSNDGYAWLQDFDNGRQSPNNGLSASPTNGGARGEWNVRAVRAF